MKKLIVFAILGLALSSCSSNSGGGSSENSEAGGSAVTAPTALSVVWPVDFNSSTTVTISGVTSGHTITLYSDSTCTTTVASGTASSTSIGLVASSLSTGTYSFYAKAALDSDESTCSTATTSYTVATCPIGYVQIPGNTTRAVAPFCVMKFEAKEVSGAATSQTLLNPWVGISANDAKAACVGLNVTDAKYNLISNQEWLTIADNIQNLVANYNQGGNPTGFVLFTRGNSGIFTTGPVSVANEADYWTQSFSSQVWDYRRIHYLSNSEIIWDLAGNASEYVDWSNDATTFTLSPTCGGAVNLSYFDFRAGPTQCPNIATTEYMPPETTWTGASNNVGTMRKFTAASVLLRSGQWNETTNAGIYAFLKSTNTDAGTPLTNVGFRCVYRPAL